MDTRSDIAPADIGQFHARALEYATQARALIRAALSAGFEVKRKPDGSYVTDVDLKIEEELRRRIARDYPAHGVIGEEFPPTNPESAFQWILDPVDGTEDFVQRLPTFGTILALHYRGLPLVGVIDHPALDVRVHAAFGLGTRHNDRRVTLPNIAPSAIDGSERLMLPARGNFTKHRDDGALFDALTRAHPNHRVYRSCLTHTCAVTGQADATVDYGNAIWDFAASRVLIEEAGGKFVVVREWDAPAIGRIYGSVMGKTALVDRVAALFRV